MSFARIPWRMVTIGALWPQVIEVPIAAAFGGVAWVLPAEFALVAAVVVTLKWRADRRQPEMAALARQFRADLQDLDPLPARYINESAGVVLGYWQERSWWRGRTSYLARLDLADVDVARLRNGDRAVVTHRLYGSANGTSHVTRRVIATIVYPDQSVEQPPPAHPGQRIDGLPIGEDWVVDELRELGAQLRDARPVRAGEPVPEFIP